MNRHARIPCLTWLLLLAATLTLPARAQEVNVYVSADSVQIGEHFMLSLTATHDPATQVTFPEPARGDSLFGDVVLLQKLPIHTRSAESGFQVDSVAYEAAAFAVDTARVPSFPIRYTVNEQTDTVAAPPLALPIISTVPADAQTIKDLAPIVPFERPWWAWLALALVVLIGAAALWRLIADVVRSRKKHQTTPTEVPRTPIRSPFEEAEERLHALQRTDPGDPAQVKPFYVELSDAVRTYLQRRLGLPALEETSRELLIDLIRIAHARNVPTHAVRRIEQVLQSADLVKFADQQPSAATSHALVGEAEHALQEVETALREAEVPQDTAQSTA